MQDYFTIQNLGVPFERPNSKIGHPGNPARLVCMRQRMGFISIAMCPWPKLVEALDDDSLKKYDDAPDFI